MPRVIIDGNNEQKNDQKVEEVKNPVVAQVQEQQAEIDPYAHMFAEWDLVPPQLVIRRIHRKG